MLSKSGQWSLCAVFTLLPVTAGGFSLLCGNLTIRVKCKQEKKKLIMTCNSIAAQILHHRITDKLLELDSKMESVVRKLTVNWLFLGEKGMFLSGANIPVEVANATASHFTTLPAPPTNNSNMLKRLSKKQEKTTKNLLPTPKYRAEQVLNHALCCFANSGNTTPTGNNTCKDHMHSKAHVMKKKNTTLHTLVKLTKEMKIQNSTKLKQILR